MSSNVEKLLGRAEKFEKIATDSLEKTAEKLDPKAKVRNRGNVCVPAESAKDKKDHFPINSEAQARNALARVNQFSSAPDWYSGSLQGLVSLVARKVKAKYPSIEVSKDAKKPGAKKSEYYDNLLGKFGQHVNYDNYGGEGVSPSQMTPEQLAQKPGDLGKLFKQNLISPDQYRAAIDILNQQNGATPGSAQWGPNSPYGQKAAPVTNAPAKPAPAKGTGGTKYRPDVVNMQRALNDMISRGKLQAKILDPDGKLGPLTQQVMDAYKASIGVPSLTNEQVIKALNTPREQTNSFPSLQQRMDAGEAVPTTGVNPADANGIVHKNPF